MAQRTDSEAVKLSAKTETRNKKKKRYPFDFIYSGPESKH